MDVQVAEMQKTLDDRKAGLVAGKRGGAEVVAADPGCRHLRGHINQLQVIINADEQEDQLLASNAAKFLRIALTNFRRWVLLACTSHSCLLLREASKGRACLS